MVTNRKENLQVYGLREKAISRQEVKQFSVEVSEVRQIHAASVS